MLASQWTGYSPRSLPHDIRDGSDGSCRQRCHTHNNTFGFAVCENFSAYNCHEVWMVFLSFPSDFFVLTGGLKGGGRRARCRAVNLCIDNRIHHLYFISSENTVSTDSFIPDIFSSYLLHSPFKSFFTSVNKIRCICIRRVHKENCQILHRSLCKYHILNNNTFPIYGAKTTTT